MKIGSKAAEVVSAVDDGRCHGRGQRPRLQGAGLPSKARLKPALQILHFIQELRPDLRKVLHYGKWGQITLTY